MEYNGWTNYATWRINLEVIQDTEFKELGDEIKRLDIDIDLILEEYE